MRTNLMVYSLEQIESAMTARDIEAYRAAQIFQWIWQKNIRDFSLMTNISKILKKTLAEEFDIKGLIIEKILKTKDGVQKFLFKTEDNQHIETVSIPEQKRRTICVSTQVGCPLNCRFCATGLMEFKRNLKAYEIADQIHLVQQSIGSKITNVVFMGMGEPLLNLEQVIKAVNIISSPIGLSISQRHMTISTVGIIKGINELLESTLKVKLAISLNFADQQLRQKMISAARDNPLTELVRAAREYSIKKSMVTFEYVLIDRINDRLEDAERLLNLVKGIPSKINLITYNPYPQLPYKKPSPAKVKLFHDFLLRSTHTITLRKPRGGRIRAGCGQLALPDSSS